MFFESIVSGRKKPEVFLKVKPEPGPNPSPTRKARPDLQLCRNLVRLAQDPSIKICKFDKGNGVAIFSAKNYYDKLDKVILDKSNVAYRNVESLGLFGYEHKVFNLKRARPLSLTTFLLSISGLEELQSYSKFTTSPVVKILQQTQNVEI